MSGGRFGNIDLRDLELFTEVVAAGSITGGAERVHLALPSASTRVRLMERAVGTALLDRGRRGVTPTPAGRLLLRHARTVLGQLDRMRGDLAQYADGLRATVRLLVNSASVNTLLPGELAPFLAAHPDIDIDLGERTSPEIAHAVAEHRADIGILASTASIGDLRAVSLRPDPLVLITPTDHPLAAHRQVRFADCLDHPFVGLAEGSALQSVLEGYAQPFGQHPSYRVRLPTPDAVCRAVAAGIGIAVLSRAAVCDLPVTMVGLTDGWAERDLLLCTAPGPAPAPAVTALAEYLRGGLGA